MAGNNNQQVLIDVQAEAQASGAENLKNLADSIVSVGGAASLSSGEIDYFIYALETLNNSKGTTAFKDIRQEIEAAAKAMRSLRGQFSGSKKQTKKQKEAFQNVAETTKANVGYIKQTNALPITMKEMKALDAFSSNLNSSSELIKVFDEELKKVIQDLRANGKLDANTLVALGISSENIRRFAYSTGINAKRTADTKAQQRRNEENARIDAYYAARGMEDDVTAWQAKSRVGNYKRNYYAGENAERRHTRNAFYGTGIKESIRQGLTRNEDYLLNSGGIKGFGARFLANKLQNTALGNAFSGGVAGAGINLGAFAGAGAAAGIAMLGKGIVDLSKASVEAYENIEKVKTSLGVVYGTQSEANSVFGDIAKFAVKSPFGVKDVAEQVSMLKQSGVESYQVMDVVKNLGDLAGGNQEKFNRLANAMSQIAANGTATQRQLRMFTMAGVPIYQSIADVKGIAKSDVLGKVKSGEVSYEDIIEALKKLTDENGPFYKAVEKGSKTIAARKQNLADIKELALAEGSQTIVNPTWWTKLALDIKEGFWQGVYENRKEARIDRQSKRAQKDAELYESVDKRLSEAEKSGDRSQIPYLKVLKMEVEQMSTLNKEQREAVWAEEYKEKEGKLEELEDNYSKAIEILNQAAGEDARFVEKMFESLGFKGVKVANFVNSETGEWQIDKQHTMDQLDYQFGKQSKDARGVRSRWGIGGRDREYTVQEKSHFATSARKIAEENAQRGIGNKKDSGVAIYEEVKKLYESSVQAQEERKQKEEAQKKALRDIYDEIKGFGLSDDNKFAFLQEKDAKGNLYTMDAAKALSLSSRYLTHEELDFKNEEQLDETMKELSENLAAYQDILLMAILKEDKGEKQRYEAVKGYVNIMKDQTQSMVAREQAFEAFNKLAENWSPAIQGIARLVGSKLSVNKIDEKYLNFEAKGRKESRNYSFDKSYASIIREIADKQLGISLYRSIGSDMGYIEGTKVFDESNKDVTYTVKKGVSDMVAYMQNSFDRKITANISDALLKQTGNKKIDWLTLSSMIQQSNKTKYASGSQKQSYYDENGNLVEGKAWGRYRKGFVNFKQTRDNLESYALSNGDASTINTVAETYKQQLENLNKFYTQTFTESENKEANLRYLEVTSLLANLEKVNPGPNGMAEWNAEITKLRTEKEQLEASGIGKQLGTEETKEFRESVTALAHWIVKANDGTKKFSEAMLEAMRIKHDEIEQLSESTTALSTFKTAIEDLANKTKDLKFNTAVNNIINENLNNLGNLGVGNTQQGQELLTNLVDYINKNEDFVKKIYGDLPPKELLSRMIKDSRNPKTFTDEKGNLREYTMADYSSQLRQSQAGAEFSRRVGTKEDFLGVSLDYKENIIKQFGDEIGEAIINSNTYQTKLTALKQANASTQYVGTGSNMGSDFKSQAEAKEWLSSLYDEIALDYPQVGVPTNEDAIAAQGAETAHLVDAIIKNTEAVNKNTYSNGSLDLQTKYNELAGAGVSLFSSDLRTYAGNTGTEQELVRYFGLNDQTNLRQLTTESLKDQYGMTNSAVGGGFTVGYEDAFKTHLEELEKYGLNLSDIQFDFITPEQLDRIAQAENKMLGMKKSTLDVEKQLQSLNKNMLNAFNSAIVDGITDSMVKLGESVRDDADYSQEIGQNLKDIFVNLLKNIGPQMTQTGLAIAAAAAEKDDWGKVAGGLALAAAGGFMSFTSGLLSEKKDTDDKDKQKEERLKTLADLLSDLIAQAKTDAEYYERNSRHRQSIETDYGVSSKSVNDMIITPQGNFSTHPDDYIIATKTPNELGGKGSPNVTITIVNQSGDIVKVSSTEKKEKDNGDIDIKATIIAVTADAVANGELDGAFAQMQSRQQGVSHTY